MRLAPSAVTAGGLCIQHRAQPGCELALDVRQREGHRRRMGAGRHRWRQAGQALGQQPSGRARSGSSPALWAKPGSMPRGTWISSPLRRLIQPRVSLAWGGETLKANRVRSRSESCCTMQRQFQPLGGK